MKIFIQIIKASSKYFKAGQGTMLLTENKNMEDHNMTENENGKQPEEKKASVRQEIAEEQKTILNEAAAGQKKLEEINDDIQKDIDQFHQSMQAQYSEMEQEYMNAGGLKGIAKEKTEQLKEDLHSDPAGTAAELGKKALMAIGAFAILKALFRR